MAFRWRADDGPTLNAGLVAAIFQGIRTCIGRKPYIFEIFQGGPDPLFPPLDLHISYKQKYVHELKYWLTAWSNFAKENSVVR